MAKVPPSIEEIVQRFLKAVRRRDWAQSSGLRDQEMIGIRASPQLECWMQYLG